jgi:putative flippase GtrA
MNYVRILKSSRFFIKAQCSAFAGVVVDYAAMIFFADFVGLHYTTSIAIGGIIGAAVNFLLNKIWAFQTKNLSYKFSLSQQLWRFICVVAGSIVLKMAGTFFFTSLVLFYFQGAIFLGYVITETLIYKYCRLITDALVFVFFNYKLQRHWVFKTVEK